MKPRGWAAIWLLILASIAAGPALAQTACPEGDSFPALYSDPSLFEEAIEAEASKSEPALARLSGITVPHHLVAAHLVARGFRAASGHDYDRVILLSPDHFFGAETPFATTGRDFETPFGRVRVDRAAVEAIERSDDLIGRSCLFAREHGVHSLLPFMKHYLPEAELVPVAVSLRAERADWDRLVERLLPLVDEETLIVQSTDFSHYLPHEVARRFDQQTLNLLAAADIEALTRLSQPDHLDSLGAMYVQMRLQQLAFGARPRVVASENQQEYVARRLDETTSYMVILFAPDASRLETVGERLYFAGDTFFGRGMAEALTDADRADDVERVILDVTGGAPMIVNLEGVILPNVPEALEHMTLGMPRELAVDWLRRLNVRAVSLANNHANDLGPSGFAETTSALRMAGIAWFGQCGAYEMAHLTIVGLTDLDSTASPQTDRITPDLLDRLVVRDAQKSAVAFVHWGNEYQTEPPEREKELFEEMRRRGVSLIVGAHPHVADGELVAIAGGDALLAYSLGNFIFDQTAETSSGTLLELTLFEQGVHFARLVEIPNLFDVAAR